MRYWELKRAKKLFGMVALAALIALPAWGQNSASLAPSQHPETATPGTLNYVEGQAKIGSQALDSQSVGKVQLQAGQTLSTGNGRAEVLLTPGVFLRIGQDTSVTMVSPSLTNTKVKVDTGEASAEVDEYHSENNLMVQVDDATAYLVHTGFYDFDPQQGLIRVLKGQAVVMRNDYHVRINPGQQVALFPQDAKLQPVKFDVSQYQKQNPLYSWSKLRSQYLAEANVNEAPYVYGWNGWGSGLYGPGWWGAGLGWGPGWGWYGPGWYWNPWFMSYTFIPGDGIYNSPFGWGFYSPRYVNRAPYAVEGGHVRDFGHGFDSWGLHGVAHTPAVHMPHIGNAFHGHAAVPGENFGTYGGGFHRGTFGFRGGGFAGRR